MSALSGEVKEPLVASPRTKVLGGKLAKFAEGVAALLLGLIFLTFLVQILARYAKWGGFDWTLELCLALWLWLTFWGTSFVLKQDEQVRFDVLYRSVSPRVRRFFALSSSLLVAVIFAVALWPTWGYIDFLKIKGSASLGVSMRTIYVIYAVFMVTTIVRQAWRFVQIWRDKEAEL